MSVPHWFAALLETHDRIAIAGGPKVGKTTLAVESGRPVIR